MHVYEWYNNKINKHQKEIQNLTKKLQIITHPSTLQSVRKIPTHNSKPWTTVQPVLSILTTTNLQLRSWLYITDWPKTVQRKDLQCVYARIAPPHPHRQQHFAQNPQRDQ